MRPSDPDLQGIKNAQARLDALRAQRELEAATAQEPHPADATTTVGHTPGNPQVGPAPGQEQKYCFKCGTQIPQASLFCPQCGTAQTMVSEVISQRAQADAPVVTPAPASSETGSDFVTKMAVLLVLNAMWNGLGNIAIGDRRGWAFGFFNWPLFVLSIFTFFVPMLLFFALCGWMGYGYLREQEARQS